jgi:Kef-type K+ transport system membrane component KefB
MLPAMSMTVASAAPLFQDVGLSILAAAALGFVARALKQPLILAYIAAGVLLGSNIGLGWIHSGSNVENVSTFGLVLLLFLIGLEIDVQKLKQSGRAVFVTGLLQLPLNLAICLAVPWGLRTFGVADDLGPYGPVYLGFALSLSSTLVVVKLLYDKQELDTMPGRITLGILVVQDLWAVLFLAVQPSLSAPEIGPLAKSLAQGAGILVGAFAAARYVLPPLFRGAAKIPELVLIGALAWCFLIAGLALAAGLSAEMGALIAGVSLSVLPYRPDVVSKVTTVRDFFLTLFFVSLGLQLTAPTPAMAVAAVLVAAFVVVSRFVVLFPVLRAQRLGDRIALLVPINLVPVSEFSLVLTAIGLQQGHVTPAVLSVVLFAMILTAVGGTYTILASHRLQDNLAGVLRRLGWAAATAPGSAVVERPYPIAILGFHRIASALLAAIEARRPDLRTEILVVDFNPVVLRGLTKRGVANVYGDLGHPEHLVHAGLHAPKVVACTLPDSLLRGTSNLRLYTHLRQVFPAARIVMTAESRAAEMELLAAGADAVLVPARAAGDCALEDLVGLFEGRSAPSRESTEAHADEVLA